jgi:hypothetical protein
VGRHRRPVGKPDFRKLRIHDGRPEERFARQKENVAMNNSSYKREYLTDHEVMNRAAPGGRLPVKGAKNNAYGDKAYTPIGDASPAAVAGEGRARGHAGQARAGG